ncbi:MAG: MoxR family ATPase, partial [Actinomycetales bacterium]
MTEEPLTVPGLREHLADLGYIADRGLATALLLALKLGKPLLLEGEVGVGKTELAKTVARMLDRDLIRLQC